MKELFDKDVESFYRLYDKNDDYGPNEIKLDPDKDPKEYSRKLNSVLKYLDEIEEEKAKEDVKQDPDKDPFVAAGEDRKENTIHFLNGVMKEVNRMKEEKAKEDVKQDKKE